MKKEIEQIVKMVHLHVFSEWYAQTTPTQKDALFSLLKEHCSTFGEMKSLIEQGNFSYLYGARN